jgi:serine/threonine protein kinase
MTDLMIIGGIAAICSILCVLVLLVVLLRKRRKRHRAREAETEVCPTCHRPLPHGSTACPTCNRTPPDSSAPATTSDERLPALIGLSGALEDQVFTISPAPRGLTIGRNPDNDVVISDMLVVSRYHAQIMPEGDAIVLYDRDSANGTVVNNQRVFRHELQDGDQIQLCGARFVFSRSGEIPPHVSTPGDPGPQTDSLVFNRDTPFEGFVLRELLGEGGMSVVYRGADAAGNTVAIKILNVTDEYIVRKFIQEQRIGDVLRNHPFIRKVYRLGRSQQGNLYLVMEYIDGCPLRRLIGALSDEEIVRVIGQSCTALAYAHKRHIVHRDIKPENILITQNGNMDVKITDFGIAKLTSSVTLTSDRVVGTPEYLSPEQARGEQSIKPCADIYSLGIVLYELLTGQVPFPLPKTDNHFRAAVTVLRQHVSTPPPLPRDKNPGVARKLEKVALRAIEKDPRKRYPTAAAMANALGYEEKIAIEPVEPEETPKFGLVITQGARRGHRIPLESDTIVIGRADLDPEDQHTSRRHAIISARGSQMWLEDTSLNGTWINGERVFAEVLLEAGDEIGIGKSVLSVVPYQGQGEAP